MNSNFYNFFAGDSFPAPEIPYEVESSVSDCESGVTGSNACAFSTATSSSGHRHRRGIFGEGLTVEVPEGDRSHELIRRRFLTGVDEKAEVVAVNRRNWSEKSTPRARIQAFLLHKKALENKYGGPPNVKFGWYGGGKERIEKILEHGFSYQDLQFNNNGAVFLSPDDSPSPSLDQSGTDEEGLRHVLLCRVLLGRSEVVNLESGQTHSSSDKFDSGVDSYENPKKYIVWSTNMNTHILPEYVVTFKVKPAQLSPKGVISKTKNGIRMPTSPWISFPSLISVLSRFLASDAISLISKYHKDYKEKKMSRPELIQKVREIAGDKLLVAVIKKFKGNKETRMPFGLSHSRNNTNNY